MEYKLTEKGIKKCKLYIKELEAKRKEVLDARLDVAINTRIPDVEEIEEEVNWDVDEDNGEYEYCSMWGVTDHYDADYPLLLELHVDFVRV